MTLKWRLHCCCLLGCDLAWLKEHLHMHESNSLWTSTGVQSMQPFKRIVLCCLGLGMLCIMGFLDLKSHIENAAKHTALMTKCYVSNSTYK
jgi:hypothetical protein